MELESVQATTGMLPKTVAKSDSSEDQVLRTAVAEIGSIQEQENQPRYRAVLHQETNCSSKVCFYRFIGPQGFGPVLELKPSMSRAREIGQELLNGKVLPLFSTYGREIWTYLQFLIILGFAVKSIVIDIAVSDPNERTAVDFVLLSFSLMFLLLSILDVCITIYIHRCSLLCTPCRRHVTNNTIVDETAGNLPSTADCGCCGSLCSLFSSRYADLVRMILNEVIVYSITICAMLQLILRTQQNGIDLRTGFSIVSFIVAVLWKTATVYGTCIFVVLRTLIAIRKIRKDGPVASTAKWFHIHLFVHVLGQVVSQVAMMVCIGVKMVYENRDFSIENTVRISGFLWYMFFGTLIVPLAGIFTFAISNFYSVQEYPIGYFLDLLHSSIRRGELGEQSAQESAEVKQSIETGMSSESVAQNI